MLDLFATLLRCDVCAHAVDLHAADGCAVAGCACVHTREGVIHMNVSTAVREQQAVASSAFQAQVRGADR